MLRWYGLACLLCLIGRAESACNASVSAETLAAEARGTLPSLDLPALLREQRLPTLALQRFSVNGIELEVGRLELSLTATRKLLTRLQQQVAADPTWRETRLGADRRMFSNWRSTHHETLTISSDPVGFGCVLTHARRDMRKPLSSVPRLPMPQPSGFQLLTATEERIPRGFMRVFTFDFRGGIPVATDQLRNALLSDGWVEREPLTLPPASARDAAASVLFAERDGAALRAAVFRAEARTRVVIQVQSGR